MSLNQVQLIGNLGADPEKRETPNGLTVANLRMATSEQWTDKNTGEKRENTEWHRIVLFGRLADVAAQYLKKGSQIYLGGKIQTRKWQDQSGNDRYTTEIVGNDLKMLDKRSGSNDGPDTQQGSRPASSSTQNASGNQQSTPSSQESDSPLGDDDVPF